MKKTLFLSALMGAFLCAPQVRAEVKQLSNNTTTESLTLAEGDVVVAGLNNDSNTGMTVTAMEVNGDATLTRYAWSTKLNVGTLTGEGNLLYAAMTDNNGPASVLRLDDATGYTGKLTMDVAQRGTNNNGTLATQGTKYWGYIATSGIELRKDFGGHLEVLGAPGITVSNPAGTITDYALVALNASSVGISALSGNASAFIHAGAALANCSQSALPTSGSSKSELHITGSGNGTFSGTLADGVSLHIDNGASQTLSGATLNSAIVNNGTLSVSGSMQLNATEGGSFVEHARTDNANGFGTVDVTYDLLSGNDFADNSATWQVNGIAVDYAYNAESHIGTLSATGVQSTTYYIQDGTVTGLVDGAAHYVMSEDTVLDLSATNNTQLSVSGSGTVKSGIASGKTLNFDGGEDGFDGTLALSMATNISSHGQILKLNNFSGVLDLCGRYDLTPSLIQLDQTKKMILNGDRASNQTGLWAGNGNLATLNCDIEIKGENEILFYGNKDININGAVSGAKLHLTNGGTVYFNNGANLNTLTVDANNTALIKGTSVIVTLNGTGSLSLAGDLTVTTLGAKKLTMADGATLTIGSLAEHDNPANLTQLTVNGNAAMNANLVMADNSALAFGDGGLLSMGCDVTIGTGTTLTVAGDINNAPVYIMTGVDNLTLGGTSIANATWTDASTVFSSINGTAIGADEYVVGFWDGAVSIAAKSVPEPTTATLSLLALAGLCLRRRRK